MPKSRVSSLHNGEMLLSVCKNTIKVRSSFRQKSQFTCKKSQNDPAAIDTLHNGTENITKRVYWGVVHFTNNLMNLVHFWPPKRNKKLCLIEKKTFPEGSFDGGLAQCGY